MTVSTLPFKTWIRQGDMTTGQGEMTILTKKRAPDAIILSMAVVFLGAFFLGPGLRMDPFYSWFYLFAWWPYIIGAEAWLWPRGRSVLFNRPGRFFTLIPLSTFIWLIFEVFNFRLENWHYHLIQRSIYLRWPGYFLAYGTVLPGLLVTRNLLYQIWPPKEASREKTHNFEPALPVVFFMGLVFLTLPVIYPRYYFPLVWGGFVLLLEPFLYMASSRCFLKDMEANNYSDIIRWLAAGLVCGIFWEFWNFWAGSKWYYTVPFVGGGKIFEMPVLGFFGFPPFALECAVMIRVFDLAHARLKEKLAPQERLKVYICLLTALTIFYGLAFLGIDLNTVDSLGPG